MCLPACVHAWGVTVCGFLNGKDVGEASGVDVERATGQVSQSDLETQFKPADQQEAMQNILLSFFSPQ